ncbi:MAG: type I-C CRISPR-associated protein Cas8c/Csd1 [Methylomonas sp.]|nr:type I-C CRISPR-associated protein Cas8c/Csd1 [Methylomonas sp.]
MSWMQKLYQTYEAGVLLDLPLEQQLMPISHTPQNAHINIVLDGGGNFRRASVLEKTQIVLPATEDSAGRSSNNAPHALADKIQYVAKDYAAFGGKKNAYFERYHQQLQVWCESPYVHPKVELVYRYIQKGTVVKDLINHGKLLYAEDQVGNKTLSNLIGKSAVEKWNKNKTTPEIYKVLTKTLVKGDLNAEDKYEFDQGDALICWSVEIPGDPTSETWKDTSIQTSWISFDTAKNVEKQLCYVSGAEQAISNKHPAKIRHSGDKAKLISSNDSNGYTYRGKFLDETQACGIGFEVSQKAHNALRWLVDPKRQQAFRNGDQVYVSWAVSGAPVPQPLHDSVWDDDFSDLEIGDQPIVIDTQTNPGQNLGQAYAIRLRNYMAGYANEIQPNDQIMLMGIDSATPGRMGVIYYREWLRDEFFERLTAWHKQFAWWQRHTRQLHDDSGKKTKIQTIWPICAPLPRDIALAAHGDIDSDAHKTLRRKTVERLLSCIIDKSPLPRDILDQCVRNASNRNAYSRDKQGNQPLWEKNLGIACALYKGYHQRTPELKLRRDYAMALEENRLDRDYLYGRLLAVADYIEEFALYKSNENRSTNAARLMQRFADRPFDTWRTIELSLQPYMHRLQVINAGFLTNRQKDIENIMVLIDHDDFTSNDKLSGEFLLGYHCQRHYYKHKPESATNSADAHDANPESGE